MFIHVQSSSSPEAPYLVEKVPFASSYERHGCEMAWAAPPLPSPLRDSLTSFMRLSLRSVSHSDVLQSCLMITPPPLPYAINSRLVFGLGPLHTFVSCFLLRRRKEGKFSFPIIHCVRAKPNDHRLLNILKQRTEDMDVKKHALAWMKQAVREHFKLMIRHLGQTRQIHTYLWYIRTRFFFFLRGRFGEQNPCPRRCVCVVPRQPDGFQTL